MNNSVIYLWPKKRHFDNIDNSITYLWAAYAYNPIFKALWWLES